MDVHVDTKNVIEVLLAPDAFKIPASIRARITSGWSDEMTELGRPGTGGRLPRLPVGVETQATVDLREELGDPQVFRSGRANLEWWEVDPKGDGAMVARLSTEDVQKGETVLAQIHGAREMCKRMNLRPRFVLVATKQSGKSTIENRLDLRFLMSAIRREELSWITFREVDRLARSVEVGSAFYGFLEKHGVDLYLTDMGRKMDWEVDSFMLTTLGGAAEFERRLILKRTSSALKRRYLEEGRGWPASKKFGFRRSTDKFLEVDPEQWPFVRRIHEDYGSISESGRGSLRELRKHLKILGCPMTHETVRRILTDPIYVTGEWGVTHDGIYYPGRKIELAEPIPAGLQAKNLALLESTKGANKTTPFGLYLLNSVEVLHARCMDQKVSHNGRTPQVPQLKGRTYDDRRRRRPLTYSHYPCPDGCRGYSLPAHHLDDAVIEILLSLADSEELQTAYVFAASSDIHGSPDAEDLDALKERVNALRRNRAKLLRQFTSAVPSEGLSGVDKTTELLAAIDSDIESCTARIEMMGESRDDIFEPKVDNLRTSMEKVLRLDRNASAEAFQRRVLLVHALISRVIVHDREDGISVEVFGHLIPDGLRFGPVDIERHFKKSIASHTPSNKTWLTRRRVTQSELFERPSWRTPRIPSSAQPFERSTEASIRSSIQIADAIAEPGRLFCKKGRAITRYEEARQQRSGLLSFGHFNRMCFKTRTSRDDAVRNALGREAALRNGRVYPQTREDVEQLVQWAIEDGFEFSPNWSERWDRFARPRPYLFAVKTLQHLSQESGVSFTMIVIDVCQRMGVPFRSVRGTRISSPLPLNPAVAERLVSGCFTTKDIVERGGPAIDTCKNFRSRGRLIGFKITHYRGTVYPTWQFDDRTWPFPVVPSITRLIREHGLTLEELESEMRAEFVYRDSSTCAADLMGDETAADWLVRYLAQRFALVQSRRSTYS